VDRTHVASLQRSLDRCSTFFAPKAQSITAQANGLGLRPPRIPRAEGPPQKTDMPQSLALILIHVVFSTKDRSPVLDPEICPVLHAYLATVARNAGCECFCAGGTADHVHLAISLARTSTTAGLIEKLKTSSSKWLKTQSPGLRAFSWQHGYGVFSVGPSDLAALRHYIGSQEEHHRKQTFQDELRALLKKYGIKHDEQYLWD
jgi:putative transposase